MASLALGIAGAALGSVFGPLGASIGWTLGSALGNLLDPQQIQGPRLSDLRLHTSSYGQTTPFLYGTMRLAGNVIDSQPELVEHEHKSGGKGGPEVTNYTYSLSFAVRLCEGEILGVRRVWANGRLVWDKSGSTDVGTDGLPMTVYLGTEDQLPDPTLEGIHGAGNVPAYRGIAYVVLADLNVSDYGNVIPNLEFEVYTAIGDIPIRISTFDAQTVAGDGTVFGVTYDRATETIRLARYGTDQTYKVRHFLLDGTPVTADDVNTTVTGAGILYGRVTNFDAAVYSFGLPDGTTQAAWWVNGVPGHTIIGPWPTPSVVTGIFIKSEDFPEGVIYFPTHLEGGLGEAIVGYPVLDSQPMATPVGTYIVPGASSSANFHLGWSDNGKVYVWDSGTGDMHELAANLGARTRYFPAAVFPSDGGFYHGGLIGSYQGLTAFDYGDFAVARLNILTNGLVFGNYPQPRGLSGMPDFQWLGGDIAPLAGGYFLGRDGVVLLNPPLKGVTLASIVADLSERAGLAGDQYDVSDLPDIVDGYIVTQQGDVRSMIQPLRDAWFFDAVERDGKIVFVKRGHPSVVTIPDDELAARGDNEEAPPGVAIVRAQDVDLPAVVNVNYVNAAADYETGSQSARRQVTNSQAEVTLQLQINMTNAKAKSVADTQLYMAQVERNRLTLFSPRKFARYEPTDVVTAGDFDVRVVSKSETRPGVIKFEGVPSFAPILVQGAAGVPGIGFVPSPPTSTPTARVATNLELFDVPLATDSDAENGIYAAVSPAAAGSWSGAAVYRSSDGGTTYTEAGTTTTASVMGTTSDALGDFDGGNIFDAKNSVRVVTTGGALSGATELAVLNGANLAVIGHELVQFKTATLVAANTYVLSGLLRGRRGTEWAIGTHSAGERFALFPMLRLASPFAELGATRQFKGVTFGAALEGAASQDFVDTGESIAPYSPVLLGGGCDSDGDVVLHWTRRTRTGGAWLNFVDVPLGETDEIYVVQIWNSSYTEVAHISLVTTEETSYGALDQINDFGALQETIFFTVGQLGAHGLGHQTRGTAVGAGSTNDDPLFPLAPYGSPGSGGSAPTLAAIAIPMVWFEPPNRKYTSSYGTFDCSSRVEVSFTTDYLTAPDVIGQISAVPYPSGSNLRVACLSSVAGDFSGTDLGPGSRVISANPIIRFSVGSNTSGLPELAPSTRYYLNVKNDDGFGSCTCLVGDCGMYFDLEVPAGTVAHDDGTWNPGYKGTGVTLSNGDLTALFSASGTQLVRGTTSHGGTGKFYFEIHCDNADNLNSAPQLGLADSSLALVSQPGLSAGSGWAYWGDSRTWDNGSQMFPAGTSIMHDGDVVMVAVDFAAGKIWFGNNGTWFASGNPATGANALYSDVTGTLYPVGWAGTSTGVQITARFAAADFTYTPPSGFSSWG